MSRRSFLAILAILGFAVGLLLPASTMAQAVAVNRPAEIREGTCAGPGSLVVILANVVLTPGDPQGQSVAVPVEQSGTVVPYTLSDLLATSHAIFVQNSPADQTVVACGEIGGAINPDGTLGVGLRGMDASGVTGVAYFTPIDTFSNLLVTILLVSNESAGTTVSTEPAIDESAQEGSLSKELDAAESP